MLVTGLTIAILAGLAAESLLRSVVIDIAPRDPLTFVSMAAFITVITVLAMFVPARRANAVDPVVALRYE